MADVKFTDDFWNVKNGPTLGVKVAFRFLSAILDPASGIFELTRSKLIFLREVTQALIEWCNYKPPLHESQGWLKWPLNDLEMTPKWNYWLELKRQKNLHDLKWPDNTKSVHIWEAIEKRSTPKIVIVEQ